MFRKGQPNKARAAYHKRLKNRWQITGIIFAQVVGVGGWNTLSVAAVLLKAGHRTPNKSTAAQTLASVEGPGDDVTRLPKSMNSLHTP